VTRLLEGNGARLVREIAVARSVQAGLARLYQLDVEHAVEHFMRPAEEGDREALLVSEEEGALYMELRVPALGARAVDLADGAALDPLCQIIEGVSHFVYMSERARAGRETTQLELELQAEVDKYVVLASAVGCTDARTSERVRERLFESVAYAHEGATEEGQRYRIANDVANRFIRRVEREHLARGRVREVREELRRFFRMGQEEKLRGG
jgi:hypothetical protein